MSKDFIGYEALTDAARRGVVREALRKIEKTGLVGQHHFYLTFKTGARGVDIPDFLREQYPDEMTVILQHQFWGLKVKDDLFEVTLTFRKLPATLVVPFDALTAFFDPGVQFGLQFKSPELADPKDVPVQIGPSAKAPEVAPPQPSAAAEPEPEKAPSAPGEVVSLDAFRKK
ncbi:MAG TPA: ClpXP protease specificity-enhancing factor SspB [Rhizomicrobium sp.]|jgi:hypothetical protein|nr:ClpXP protease specificity-enhancing factor SspB [Rhizomicrobium sp.]